MQCSLKYIPAYKLSAPDPDKIRVYNKRYAKENKRPKAHKCKVGKTNTILQESKLVDAENVLMQQEGNKEICRCKEEKLVLATDCEIEEKIEPTAEVMQQVVQNEKVNAFNNNSFQASIIIF